MMTGVDMVHVPYRGAAPALTDLIGGQVQVMFGDMPSSIEHIRAGKLRPLAVTTTALPDLPPLAISSLWLPRRRVMVQSVCCSRRLVGKFPFDSAGRLQSRHRRRDPPLYRCRP